ncbi:hypothetical protein CHCC14809_0898 [Bacillus licheniformis]|uniref:Uncharacterized protein n=1 Tax=Bacillus licheniformis TaxID=1402 RepID=A0A8B5YI88_BACLI|nr:hypothetical protein B4090_3334 [Bacillus licheniformis]KYC78956.1 hypothetical protein B4092_3255 [Bacillus licheniformis]KYC80137.1 hypothetical protein B4091_3534 [Bacillus licheniformis]KYC93342.1 hypothetical protein B4164_3224 [Bacillus licheniformis]OLF86163.1 hypothetical protein B4094_4627 [Bacillus licheniformis]
MHSFECLNEKGRYFLNLLRTILYIFFMFRVEHNVTGL